MDTENLTPPKSVSEMLRVTSSHVTNLSQLGEFLIKVADEVAGMEATIAQLQERITELEGKS
jgi:hypothetical protein